VEFDRNIAEPHNESHNGGNDDFERELRQALERRPAPPRLKRRVMEEVRRRREPKPRYTPVWWWQRAAAVLVLGGAVSGALVWRHQVEERRRGEEARRQVMIAFRITGHALTEMNSRLASHDRSEPQGDIGK